MTNLPTTRVLSWHAQEFLEKYSVVENEIELASFVRPDASRQQGKLFIDLSWGEKRYRFINEAINFIDIILENKYTKMIDLNSGVEVCTYSKQFTRMGILTSTNVTDFSIRESGVFHTKFQLLKQQTVLLTLSDKSGWSDPKHGLITFHGAESEIAPIMEVVWMSIYQHILKCSAKVLSLSA